MIVSKWGNSLAVRLPSTVVKQLHLKEGDEIELRPLDGNAFAVVRLEQRDAALVRLRSFRGLLPEDYKFDREEANER